MAEGVQIAITSHKHVCYICGCDIEGSICRMEELICPSCSIDYLEEVIDQDPDSSTEEVHADESELDSVTEDDEKFSYLSGFGMNNLISQMMLNVRNMRRPGEIRHQDLEEEDEEGSGSQGRATGRSGLSAAMDDLVGALNEVDPSFSERRARHRHSENFNDMANQLMDLLNDFGRMPVGEPLRTIWRLETYVISQRDVAKGSQCTICMEDYKVRDVVKLLNCGHFYHEECLKPWVYSRKTCPTCRTKIDPTIKAIRPRYAPGSFSTLLPDLDLNPERSRTLIGDEQLVIPADHRGQYYSMFP